MDKKIAEVKRGRERGRKCLDGECGRNGKEKEREVWQRTEKKEKDEM